MKTTQAWQDGYEAKAQEIREMGFEAARNAFNLANPPGQKWTGSADGFQYACGEMEALVQSIK